VASTALLARDFFVTLHRGAPRSASSASSGMARMDFSAEATRLRFFCDAPVTQTSNARAPSSPARVSRAEYGLDEGPR